MAAGVVFAVGMVKDEADVIGHTVDHLFSEGVDGVIVADNGSTDGTRDLLAARKTQGAALEIVDDPELGYYQAEKMSRLAERAHRLGAEWVIPFDADELWWSWSGTVGATLRRAKRETKVVEAHLWNYFPTDLDPISPNPFLRIVHRQPAFQALPKVAVRWEEGSIIWQGNHGASMFREGGRETLLEIAHFPYRSPDQFVRKALNGAAAYKATVGLPPDAGAHWRGYGEAYERGGEAALVEIYDRWFHQPTPDTFDPPLVHDPARFMLHG